MTEKRLKIIIDTREQTPWAFPEHYAVTTRGTLTAGDYALNGDSSFALERKSLDDFLGTISTGWDRFCRELARMNELKFPAKVIIVEGNFVSVTFRKDEDGYIIPPKHNHPQLTPSFVCARIADLTLMQVSVLFAHNSILAAGMATTILRHRARSLDNDNNNGSSKPYYISESV